MTLLICRAWKWSCCLLASQGWDQFFSLPLTYVSNNQIFIKLCTNICDPQFDWILLMFPLVPSWSWHLWFSVKCLNRNWANGKWMRMDDLHFYSAFPVNWLLKRLTTYNTFVHWLQRQAITCSSGAIWGFGILLEDTLTYDYWTTHSTSTSWATGWLSGHL